MTGDPPDPFTPADVGYVALIEMFHGLVAAGATPQEAAMIVAALARSARDE